MKICSQLQQHVGCFPLGDRLSCQSPPPPPLCRVCLLNWGFKTITFCKKRVCFKAGLGKGHLRNHYIFISKHAKPKKKLPINSQEILIKVGVLIRPSCKKFKWNAGEGKRFLSKQAKEPGKIRAMSRVSGGRLGGGGCKGRKRLWDNEPLAFTVVEESPESVTLTTSCLTILYAPFLSHPAPVMW